MPGEWEGSAPILQCQMKELHLLDHVPGPLETAQVPHIRGCWHRCCSQLMSSSTHRASRGAVAKVFHIIIYFNIIESIVHVFLRTRQRLRTAIILKLC